MVAWGLLAEAQNRRNIPQVICTPEGYDQNRSSGLRVYPGVEGMGRDLEEPLRDQGDVQIHNPKEGDVEPPGQSPGVVGQHSNPGPNTGAAIEDRLEGGLGKSVSFKKYLYKFISVPRTFKRYFPKS